MGIGSVLSRATGRRTICDSADERSRTYFVPTPRRESTTRSEDAGAAAGVRTADSRTVRGLPRATLPSRFGPELLLRLDQMFGDREELLASESPPIPIRVEQRWDHPLTDPESVLHVVETLLRKLIDQLASARQNTACVQLSWKLEQGDAPELTIRLLRPTQQFQRVWELLTLQLERVAISAWRAGALDRGNTVPLGCCAANDFVRP